MRQFPSFEPSPVIQRCVVADGEARSLLVVELAVPVESGLELLPAAALLDVEVDDQFLFYPAVQRLVDGVVRGFSRPGHGAYDVRVLYQLVVGEGGVHTPLVRVQDCGVRASPQHLPDVVQPVDVLVSGASALGHLVGEQLLGEHIEVERDLEVEHPELEDGHVGDDDLPGSVHCFPCGVDQVRVLVPYLAWHAPHPVQCLRPHPEVTEALVRVVVADADSHVDPDKGRCPAVPVCAVLLVHLLYGGYHLLAVDVSLRGVAFLPFVEARPAHAHHPAEVVDVVVAGQQLDYFELLSFKRTYSGSPSSFI